MASIFYILYSIFYQRIYVLNALNVEEMFWPHVSLHLEVSLLGLWYFYVFYVFPLWFGTNI